MRPNAEDLVELTTRANELDAGLVREVLKAGGVDSWQLTAKGISLGAFGASTFNPTTVLVRKEDVERAQAALDQNRQDSVDIDWAEVDVGEPEDEVARKVAAEEPIFAIRATPAQRRAGMWVVIAWLLVPLLIFAMITVVRALKLI